MRLRLVSLATATAVAIGLVYFLWPQGAPPPAPVSAPEQSRIEAEAPLLSPPREPEPTTQEPGTVIRGITTDTDGSPLEGTDILHRVLAIAPDQHCHDLPDMELELNDATELLNSDARGYFSLPFQPVAGPDNSRRCLIVSAHKRGYLATTGSLPLDMDEPPRLIEVELSPNRSLSGRVIDPANRPVDNAKVIAWQDQASDAAEQNCVNVETEPVATTNTQPGGEFIVHLADDEAYCLQAFHPDWSRSQPQRVTSADPGELQLNLGYRAQVSGTVVDLQGAPQANLALSLVATNPNGHRDQALTSTDGNGDFVFDHLDYAEYQLTSASPDYQVAEPQEIAVTETRSQRKVTVKVFPVTLISGRVSDAYGEALGQVEITAYSPYDKNSTLAKTRSNARGEFTLPSLHRSHIAYDSFRMATSMLDGSAANQPFSGELCLDFFHPRRGSHALSLAVTESTLDLGSIQLQRPAMQIEGRVLNHRDQALAATLVVTPGDAQTSQGLEVRMPRCEDFAVSRHVNADAEGQFSFSLPSPGTYTVEVRTDRYKTRTFEFEFTASTSDVEIKLD